MILIIQYYNDNNRERQKEYESCLEMNLNNPVIKEIHNIIEKDTIMPIKYKNNIKLKNIEIDYSKTRSIPGRLTFEYVFNYAKEFISLNEIVCICNLDIFLEYSMAWLNIETDFFNVNSDKKKVLCLSRIDVLKKNCITSSYLKTEFNTDLIGEDIKLNNNLKNFNNYYDFGKPKWWFEKSESTWPGASSVHKVFKNNINI